MKTQFDIEKVLEAGKLQNELEYERALIADRKLRVLCKENFRLKPVRKHLRDLIEKHEDKNWRSSAIDKKQIKESDIAELVAEKERQFAFRRKALIKGQLKKFTLNQQDLMTLLGHKSKTYMSELMNGIVPFTINDLIIINRLLKINLSDLIPTTISQKRKTQIRKSIQAIGATKLKLSADDFDLILT